MIAFVVGEDAILSSSFYREYLQGLQLDESKTMIDKKDIPSVVLESFSESPFGEFTIDQVYTISASGQPHWSNYLRISDNIEKNIYVLAISDQPHATRLHYNQQGKLVSVQNM
jgi:hypothetical protein